jgi:hypothetical protein
LAVGVVKADAEAGGEKAVAVIDTGLEARSGR